KARNLGTRRLARLQQRVFRRDVYLGAIDDELGHRALPSCATQRPDKATRSAKVTMMPAIMSNRTRRVRVRHNRCDAVIMVISIPLRLAPSGAPCRLPQMRRHGVVPAERVIARSVVLEVIEPRDGFCNARGVAFRDPPHDEMRSVHALEPFLLAAVK